jgi:hypothetical protein
MTVAAVYPDFRGRFLAIRLVLFLFILLLVFVLQTQTVIGQSVKTIGDPGLDKYTLYNTYGPMRSVPGAFTNGPISNRHAYIFPASSLGGIPAQSLLDSMAFYKVNAGALQGTVGLKLYLKNTTANDFGAASLNWEAEKAGATLVYNASPIAATAGTAGYKKLLFLSSFLYTGSNLELLVEYSQSMPATDYLSWAWDNISVPYPNNSVKFDYALSETPPASLTSTANIHPVLQVYYTAPVVAPVKLVDFSVAASSKGRHLKWTTAEESNVLAYYVEKSVDGTSFRNLGEVPSKANASSNQYEFIDVEQSSERQYYRLQVKDKDGKGQYSKTILIQANDKPNAFKVRPNPARDVIYIQLPGGGMQETASLQIVDAAGKMYPGKKVQLGTNTIQTTIDISQLPPGNYRLLLQGKENNSYQSFVKM